MGDFPVAALYGAVGLISVVVAFLLGRRTGGNDKVAEQRRAKATADETATRILDEARREAETARKSAIVEGKEEILQLRESIEKEMRDRRSTVEREEKRVLEREGQLDRAREQLEGREVDVQSRISELGRRDARLVERERELERHIEEERRRLEQVAGLSAEQAKAELVRRMEDAAIADAANRLREIRETSRRNAEREAKKIVALAVQRVAAETTAETTVSAVSLPNDEMKGRIIGREGRNIRAFELATGVDHRRHTGHGGGLLLRSRSSRNRPSGT